ncbi:DUF4145 domain-containing protein [Curtobacterium sp. 20TX0008]|uniref:DUF4145 domain-containing protein n=1 Tax=Curtobacterium sp. 20TX0008 TaxID=3022018 RepID=UPI00232AC188|nr:DUF4145 domain-containing protein [Curtobacterium sp. 20TX0008]MDB6425959.1 DUF4145 domain-containing protein [Curtobacterium sp. 20TX0008]
MPTILCPYCAKYSHVTLRWGQVFDSGAQVRAAASCDFCSRLSVVEGRDPSASASPGFDLGSVGRVLDRAGSSVTWLPMSAETPEVPDVPAPIERAAKEAYRSASIGNHMAAILMARTVIEATAKTKGISNGVLASKINAMRDAQLIRPAIAEQAHEVRFAGNDMAHGDIDLIPDAVDSEEILALMASVLTEVFQDPARLERIRAKRTGG